ncbi:hypothetical protein H9Q72_010468 [Fusarium xylarioides]|uniref:Uncharacterized protein n=1 Tax=Fusarium xylarioides TaxID=221167 RepID=A0A9P7HSL4_9HYPO|nr:hypothetical protein H9Q72_010468 [Fusarium xylarioides]
MGDVAEGASPPNGHQHCCQNGQKNLQQVEQVMAKLSDELNALKDEVRDLCRYMTTAAPSDAILEIKTQLQELLSRTPSFPDELLPGDNPTLRYILAEDSDVRLIEDEGLTNSKICERLRKLPGSHWQDISAATLLKPKVANRNSNLRPCILIDVKSWESDDAIRRQSAAIGKEFGFSTNCWLIEPRYTVEVRDIATDLFIKKNYSLKQIARQMRFGELAVTTRVSYNRLLLDTSDLSVALHFSRTPITIMGRQYDCISSKFRKAGPHWASLLRNTGTNDSSNKETPNATKKATNSKKAKSSPPTKQASKAKTPGPANSSPSEETTTKKRGRPPKSTEIDPKQTTLNFGTRTPRPPADEPANEHEHTADDSDAYMEEVPLGSPQETSLDDDDEMADASLVSIPVEIHDDPDQQIQVHMAEDRGDPSLPLGLIHVEYGVIDCSFNKPVPETPVPKTATPEACASNTPAVKPAAPTTPASNGREVRPADPKKNAPKAVPQEPSPSATVKNANDDKADGGDVDTDNKQKNKDKNKNKNRIKEQDKTGKDNNEDITNGSASIENVGDPMDVEKTRIEPAGDNKGAGTISRALGEDKLVDEAKSSNEAVPGPKPGNANGGMSKSQRKREKARRRAAARLANPSLSLPSSVSSVQNTLSVVSSETSPLHPTVAATDITAIDHAATETSAMDTQPEDFSHASLLPLALPATDAPADGTVVRDSAVMSTLPEERREVYPLPQALPATDTSGQNTVLKSPSKAPPLSPAPHLTDSSTTNTATTDTAATDNAPTDTFATDATATNTTTDATATNTTTDAAATDTTATDNAEADTATTNTATHNASTGTASTDTTATDTTATTNTIATNTLTDATATNTATDNASTDTIATNTTVTHTVIANITTDTAAADTVDAGTNATNTTTTYTDAIDTTPIADALASGAPRVNTLAEGSGEHSPFLSQSLASPDTPRPSVETQTFEGPSTQAGAVQDAKDGAEGGKREGSPSLPGSRPKKKQCSQGPIKDKDTEDDVDREGPVAVTEQKSAVVGSEVPSI